MNEGREGISSKSARHNISNLEAAAKAERNMIAVQKRATGDLSPLGEGARNLPVPGGEKSEGLESFSEHESVGAG